jgi:hypothetical protein
MTPIKLIPLSMPLMVPIWVDAHLRLMKLVLAKSAPAATGLVATVGKFTNF